uniref:Uncharacterized protein n=1 Tax=Arundo donax TaxID=35708 RepID=A0A0A8YB21_ARUDO
MSGNMETFKDNNNLEVHKVQPRVELNYVKVCLHFHVSTNKTVGDTAVALKQYELSWVLCECGAPKLVVIQL